MSRLRATPCDGGCRHPSCAALCVQPARQHRAWRIFDWVVTTFGHANAHPHERAMRFMEEAFELAQACGLSVEELHKLCAHVYGKPTGEIAQEIGGVALTLLVLGAAHDKDVETLEVREFRRVLALDPEHLRQRHNAKADAGVAERVSDDEALLPSSSPHE